MAKGLVQFIFGFIFWVVVLFYLLVDGKTARMWFRDTLPMPADEQQLLSARFMDMASSLVVGNGLAGIIQGVAGGVVFAAAGLPGPVLWGAVMGILAFIPVIGISIVFIPAFLILLIAGETFKAFAVFVPLVLISTVVEYWLKPMLVGRRGRDAHPARLPLPHRRPRRLWRRGHPRRPAHDDRVPHPREHLPRSLQPMARASRVRDRLRTRLRT